MSSSTMRWPVQILLLVFVCVTLTACVIPILPGLEAGWRENLVEHASDFIIPGVTTREDVLMQLGEQDSLWPESRLEYHTTIKRGGIIAVIPGAGGSAGYGYHRELRRALIIEFDKAGLVTSTHLRVELCSTQLVAGGVRVSELKSCDPVEEATSPGAEPKADDSKVER